ncbi:MAG: ParA family protein [Gammaproteobacteria bacterium]|nr:ParA family protein [Gammaproteobacteria bacterium]
MIINPKGGSGKSTVSCNLAGYYSNAGKKVTLLDMDPQKSSLSWLRNRPAESTFIRGLSAIRESDFNETEDGYLILDTPAAVAKNIIPEIIAKADTLIIPVLPSPIDIQAARIFIYQLLLKHRITSADLNIAVVANRVRSNTLAYKTLNDFINTLNIPFITSLHENSVYLKTAEKGLSIFDFNNKLTRKLSDDWNPLISWLSETEARKKIISSSNKAQSQNN